MFESGNLNPGVIQQAVEFPDILIDEMDTQNPKTMEAIAAMESDLSTIKSVCTREGADLMLISVPSGAIVDVNFTAAKAREMGLIVTDELLSRRTMDSLYKSFAKHIGASFLEFTDLFRQASRSEILYFRFDGHLTPAGQGLLGDSLASFLSRNYFKETSIVHQARVTK